MNFRKHPMTRALFAASLVSGLIAGIATAGAADAAAPQTSKPPAYAAPVIADANAMRAADELPHVGLRQQMQDKLSKAGFSDIKITPSSFYVQAKDKKGEPVAMVIGPDSFAEVTEIPAQHAQSTVGQAQPSINGTTKQP